jgi:hypothetical protein
LSKEEILGIERIKEKKISQKQKDFDLQSLFNREKNHIEEIKSNKLIQRIKILDIIQKRMELENSQRLLFSEIKNYVTQYDKVLNEVYKKIKNNKSALSDWEKLKKENDDALNSFYIDLSQANDEVKEDILKTVSYSTSNTKDDLDSIRISLLDYGEEILSIYSKIQSHKKTYFALLEQSDDLFTGEFQLRENINLLSDIETNYHIKKHNLFNRAITGESSESKVEVTNNVMDQKEVQNLLKNNATKYAEILKYLVGLIKNTNNSHNLKVLNNAVNHYENKLIKVFDIFGDDFKVNFIQSAKSKNSQNKLKCKIEAENEFLKVKRELISSPIFENYKKLYKAIPTSFLLFFSYLRAAIVHSKLFSEFKSNDNEIALKFKLISQLENHLNLGDYTQAYSLFKNFKEDERKILSNLENTLTALVREQYILDLLEQKI